MSSFFEFNNEQIIRSLKMLKKKGLKVWIKMFTLISKEEIPVQLHV